MRGIVAEMQSERLIVIPYRWVGLKHKYAGLITLLMSFVLGGARLPLESCLVSLTAITVRFRIHSIYLPSSCQYDDANGALLVAWSPVESSSFSQY
jgi:hypothetical protein